MVGQICLFRTENVWQLEGQIKDQQLLILDMVNAILPLLLQQQGGGASQMEARVFPHPISQVVINITINTVNGTGVNLIDRLFKAVAPRIAGLFDAELLLAEVSIAGFKRCATASGSVPITELTRFGKSGLTIAERIKAAWLFANHDPYRVVTHNKTVLDGIAPLVLATGNDLQAVNANAHAFATHEGIICSLTTWRIEYQPTGSNVPRLHGNLRIPLPVGVAQEEGPLPETIATSLRLLNVRTSGELAQVMAAVGLANNFAALFESVS
jgi:hydroxymethylglutaryl-CoA reductase